MRCSNCKKELKHTVKFCPYCGKSPFAKPTIEKTREYKPVKTEERTKILEWKKTEMPNAPVKPKTPAEPKAPVQPKPPVKPEAPVHSWTPVKSWSPEINEAPVQPKAQVPPENFARQKAPAEAPAVKADEPEPQYRVSWHDEGAEELIDDEERWLIKKENKRFLIIELSLVALILVLIGAIFFVVNNGKKDNVYIMEGESMTDTIQHGDELSAVELDGAPKCGDIVVIERDGAVFIRRVIATGGQSLYLGYDSEKIYVNGEVISEPYIKGSTFSGVTEDYRVPDVIPEGKVFVLCDNRSDDTDSRNQEIGLIDESEIIGRVDKINGKEIGGGESSGQEETK